jgi:hypothetical protein
MSIYCEEHRTVKSIRVETDKYFCTHCENPGSSMKEELQIDPRALIEMLNQMGIQRKNK